MAKTTNVIIRVSEELKAAWKESARDAGVSMTDWISHRCSVLPPSPVAKTELPVNPMFKGGDGQFAPAGIFIPPSTFIGLPESSQPTIRKHHPACPCLTCKPPKGK